MPGVRFRNSATRRAAIAAAITVAASVFAVLGGQVAAGAKAPSHTHAQRSYSPAHHGAGGRAGDSSTATPIKHLVVIYQENVSFDHYFGTYPHATNQDGQPFHAAPGTPTVNGLSRWLRTNNPNLSNPARLTSAEAASCDQDHGYGNEQKAFDNGLMDQFVQDTGRSLTIKQCLANEGNPAAAGENRPNYAVMGYYDGNTVTGLWNYAQHFAMSDNSWSDGFGPSTPGAFNVTSGNTYGVICGPPGAAYNSAACTDPTITSTSTVTPTPGSPQAQGTGTTYSDADPYNDVCSRTQDGHTASQDIQMGGQNVGDLMNHANVTWGWFQGGFASPNYVPGDTSSDNLSQVCTGAHQNILGNSVKDYSPHHEPFQYYRSTSNPEHLPPTSISTIGQQDQANHQYDLKDFWAAADNGNIPAVSYLKAAEYQDGHAGYSDPLDEQKWLAQTINHLEHLPTWKSTMVVIAYDDSDGWYDHQMGPILNQSQTPLDSLTGTEPAAGPGTYSGQCGTNSARVPKADNRLPEQARCGVGMRQPLLVISPYSKRNFVDNHLTTQASVVKFIEDNWLGRGRIGNASNDALTGSLTKMLDFQQQGDNRLFLDPSTGQPTDSGNGG